MIRSNDPIAGLRAGPHPIQRGIFLVVDDHEDTLNILVKVLESVGARVVAARSGAEAMAAMRALVPAAALVDVQMPEMTGLELLAWMKEQPRLAKVPVVLCSAGVTERDISTGLAMGAAAYVEKLGDRWLGVAEMLTKLAVPPSHP